VTDAMAGLSLGGGGDVADDDRWSNLTE